MKRLALIAALLSLAMARPAAADVVQSNANGFELTQALTIDKPIAQTWAALRSPQKWWSKDHTYSDDSANLSMDVQAGGCFCERIPKGQAGAGSSVEHGHITYVAPGRMIRMVGSLGPLQAEAVIGTLTFRLDPEGDNATRVTWGYVVGGYVRAGADTLAPKVDEVLALQLINLKSYAENAPEEPKPAPGR